VAALHERRAGTDESMLARIENFVPYHEGLASLLTTGRMLDLMTACCGEPVVLFKDKINFVRRPPHLRDPRRARPPPPDVDNLEAPGPGSQPLTQKRIRRGGRPSARGRGVELPAELVAADRDGSRG
jgi:hypothetical protein